MKLEKIINFLNEKIPEKLALDFDSAGLCKKYDLSLDIRTIKIYMDLLVEDDDIYEDTLIITHHPPLFTPKTPTYTIHSNWDIIDGGANEALADTLNLNIIDYFDKKTKIGRICQANCEFIELKKEILDNFEDVRIVNNLNDDMRIENIGIISGFGLSNEYYVELAKDKNLDILISGDLCQKTAILAKNLNITLIDLKHHESEVPGLYYLKDMLKPLDLKIEIIDKKPIEKLTME